jgi:DNA-binding LacI/PurR family transcriptional regulator
MLDRLLHALTQEAHERGYNLLVFNAEDDAAEIRAYEHLRRTNNMDGFLLTSTTATDHRTDWLREHDVPFVAFGRPWGREESVAPTGHDWIDVDGGAGTEDATLALLEKGRCHIAFLGWPPDQGSGDDRRAGWARALATVGIDPVPELERRVPSTFPESARAASQLIAAGADAIVCACDAHALGALSRAQVESPRLAPWIVGFDDTPVARVLGMSSIDQPIEASAARMIDLLLHRIEHPGQPYADESSTDLPLLRPEVRFRNPGT